MGRISEWPVAIYADANSARAGQRNKEKSEGQGEGEEQATYKPGAYVHDPAPTRRLERPASHPVLPARREHVVFVEVRQRATSAIDQEGREVSFCADPSNRSRH